MAATDAANESSSDLAARWPVWVLRAAAVHCSAWGLFIILMPASSATVYGFDKPLTDVFLWKGSGLILLLFGIGYGIASTDPSRHWAMVFAGLVAKVLGPIGMAWSAWNGEVSARVLVLIPFNDILWWIPMALIIRTAWHPPVPSHPGTPGGAALSAPPRPVPSPPGTPGGAALSAPARMPADAGRPAG